MNKSEDINDEKPRVLLNEYKITKVIFNFVHMNFASFTIYIVLSELTKWPYSF